MKASKEDRAKLVLQVGRMSCLNFFNTLHKEGKAELVDTLEKCCLSVAHTKRVVNHIIESVDDIPPPAEIHRVAYELRPETVTRRCQKCSGTGWLVVTVNGIEGVKPCPNCRAGVTT